MNPPNHRPTEMYLGTSVQRRDLLRQEARAGRRPIVALSTMLVLVCGFVGLAAIVGPGRAIDWLVNYFVPVVVVTGVIIASLALVGWSVKMLPESPLRDWYQ